MCAKKKRGTKPKDWLVLTLGLIVCGCAWYVGQPDGRVVTIAVASQPESVTPNPKPEPEPEPTPDEIRDKLISNWQSKLKKELAAFAAQQPNEYGIFVLHLDSGKAASYQPDKAFITASLYKPFASLQALKLVDTGQLSLGMKLKDVDGRNLEQCIIDAITVSDNPCGHAVATTSGVSVAQLRADGYQITDLSQDYPITSARDVARLFEHIYDGDLLSPASNTFLLDNLKQQQVNDRLPLGLPEGVLLAHKTGDLESNVHDAGIAYSKDGDYIVVVLSGPDDSGRYVYERYEVMGGLATKIHNSIKKLASQIEDAGLSWP